MSPRIGRTLGGFHHRVDRRLANMQSKRDIMVRWVYLPLDASKKAVGLEEVEMHILCRQITVTRYIVTFPILELCLAVERRSGAQVSRR